MKEIWKDIPGYEGLYSVSNLGNIKSLSKKQEIIGKNQYKSFKCTKKQNETLLKQKTTRDGYYEVGLRKNNDVAYIRVHRLVALAFIPNPNELPVINHKNHNRKDNKVENLEWCSIKYNNRYSKAKKVVQLDKSHKTIKIWECMSDVYNELGISVSNISKCCKNNKFTAKGFYWKYYNE